jgi:hypothetical protein
LRAGRHAFYPQTVGGRMRAIDVSDAIERFKAELASGCGADRRALIRAIFERWAYDDDLTVDSQHRARAAHRAMEA